MKKIKILMVSAELTPLAKVGGLGDVVGALPKTLAKLGCEIKIVLPFYSSIDSNKYKVTKIVDELLVFFGGKNEKISLWETKLPGTNISIILVKHKYFDGKQIYQDKDQDIKRFGFFSVATLEAIKSINWRPEVIHCHDWHTALIPVLLKSRFSQEDFYKSIKVLYTIHNLASQGKAQTSIIELAGLNPEFMLIKLDANDGVINFMWQGLSSADLINTVSPTYAKEILTKELGLGLEDLLKGRKKDLFGVLNGIDVETFNPKTDKCLNFKYDSNNLAKKSQNKQILQKQLGLPINKQVALIGVVSRFVCQKGIELITDKFAKLNCQFVFLGTGQPEFENQLIELSKKFPSKFSAQIIFDVKLAQEIYAGADIFLMPSRFEPCGLGQMIAMRYGTIPVVRATGGLADTVNSTVGFSFKPYRANVLYKTLEQALQVYHSQPKTWLKLQKTGMKKDFSWLKPAKEYIKLYKKLAKIK